MLRNGNDIAWQPGANAGDLKCSNDAINPAVMLEWSAKIMPYSEIILTSSFRPWLWGQVLKVDSNLFNLHFSDVIIELVVYNRSSSIL